MLRVLLIIIILFNVLYAKNSHLSVQLYWKYQFEFAGYIAALENGYYKELGVDVKLKEYDNSVDVISDVINQKSDLGIYSSSIFEQAAKNSQIMIVANYLKRSGLVFVTKQDIVTPIDLVGKRVMAGGFELDNSSLATMLRKFDISKSDFDIVEHNFEINDFVNNKIDAMTTFISNQTFFLQEKNISYNIIDPANYGIFGFEQNLFGNKEFILNNQDLIDKFLEATKKGWEYALANPIELCEIIYNKYSNHKSIEALIYESHQIKKLMMPNNYEIGSIDLNMLQNFIAGLKEDLIVDDTYDVLQSLYNKKTIENYFTQQEREYLRYKQEIKMCIDPMWMPYEKIENGKHIGMSSDFFKIFQSNLNIPIKLISTSSWEESMQKAKNKECDILSLATKTPDRSEYLNFTSSYIDYPWVIVTNMDKLFVTDITSILATEKIGVVRGYAPYDIYSKKVPNHKMVLVRDIKEGLDKVRSGELYGFVDALPVIGYELQKHYAGELKVAGKFDDMIELSVAVNKDDEILLNIFEKLIQGLSTEDKNDILNRWITLNIEEKIIFNYIWESLFAIVLIIAFFLFRQIKLESKKKELEEALKSIQKLIDSTMEAIFIFDKQECIDVNTIAVELLGYGSKEEMIGKRISDFISKKSQKSIDKYFKEDLVVPYEIDLVKEDGTLIPALVQGRYMTLGSKKIRISSALDLSALKHKDKLLFHQSKMASMGEMIGNIAHQWRQPLSVISTISTALKFQIELDMINKEELIKDMSTLNETAQYLSKTIDDFRNFFSLKSEKITFNLSDAVQKDIALLSASFKNHFIKVESSFDDSVEVEGFVGELTQAILNILNNAKDAFKLNDVFTEDRVIIINIYKKDRCAKIDITDSAGGIKDSIIEKIFEPYFTTKHQSQGTGIGLYMTYEIITKKFKGVIRVENKDFTYNNKNYRGAMFKISIPIKEENA